MLIFCANLRVVPQFLWEHERADVPWVKVPDFVEPGPDEAVKIGLTSARRLSI